MIETTLAHLGLLLSETFEVEKARVGFVDREYLFKLLSLQQLPLTMPCVAYSFSEVSIEGGGNSPTRPFKFVGSYNLNLTQKTTIKALPVTLPISITLITNNLKDYFEFIRRYCKLINSVLEIKFIEETIGLEVEMVLPIVNVGSLSTPPGGKEGRDFDRGIYYVLEGTFNVNSLVVNDVAYEKVIRKFSPTWQVNVIGNTFVKI